VTGAITVIPHGDILELNPPANPGSGVAGDAYKVYVAYTAVSGGGCLNNFFVTTYSCNDVAIIDSSGNCSPSDTCNNGGVLPPCSNFGCLTGTDSCTGSNLTCSPPSQPPGTRTNAIISLPAHATTGFSCDKRTGAMITAGCVPCGLSSIGKVITVRDSTGAQVSKTITA
jgi:hypothetical protein